MWNMHTHGRHTAQFLGGMPFTVQILSEEKSQAFPTTHSVSHCVKKAETVKKRTAQTNALHCSAPADAAASTRLSACSSCAPCRICTVSARPGGESIAKGPAFGTSSKCLYSFRSESCSPAQPWHNSHCSFVACISTRRYMHGQLWIKCDPKRRRVGELGKSYLRAAVGWAASIQAVAVFWANIYSPLPIQPGGNKREKEL